MPAVAARTRRPSLRPERLSRKAIFRQACRELYASDPVGYCEDVLGLELTEDQAYICHLATQPPYKVLVRSGSGIGKSLIAAALMSWRYDTRDPGFIISTGPRQESVRGILWKELRSLRRHLGGFPGPEGCILRDSPNHFAIGSVARSSEGFRGQHGASATVIIDECTGVEEPFWTAAETMLDGSDYLGLALCNPTSTSSHAWQVEQTGSWRVVELSCLDHPNIAAQLAGRAPPFPAARRLERVTEMVRAWSAPVSGTPEEDDLEWPPGSGEWWRPGPECDAFVLGKWPRQAVNSLWSEAAWARCEQPCSDDSGPLELGCDVARFGDDRTSAFARKGRVAIDYASRVKQDTTQTTDMLIGMVERLAPQFEDMEAKVEAGQERPKINPREVPIKVDDSGVGGGVTDQLRHRGYRGVPCLASSSARDQRRYPNKRSETWFELAESAAAGQVCLTRLPAAVRAELRRQLLGVKYSLDGEGKRVVERKEVTKDRLKRSPDDADALMNCYCTFTPFVVRRIKGGSNG